jgi:alpha-L-rhamnosidase
MCECAGMLYSDASLIEKSEKIRAKIREESYNGEYFVDHRIDGSDCSDHISEACQYYAFFTKTATKDTYPELWSRIENELGPNIDSEKVKKANAFIGNYLRLVIFEREKCWRRILDETLDYFYYMAARTGTLWEKINTQNSLNHGFSSYAAVLIYNATEALFGENG